MPKEDGLVPDVQSRASGAVYNWKQRFNECCLLQSEAIAKVSS